MRVAAFIAISAGYLIASGGVFYRLCHAHGWDVVGWFLCAGLFLTIGLLWLVAATIEADR